MTSTSASSRGGGGHSVTPMMLREDTALAALKTQLGVSYSAIGMNPPPDAVDGFLMRYVRDADLNVNKAVEGLKKRRDFERALPGVSVTSYVVSSLRSGAFGVIGEDIMHRPILHVRLSHYRATSDASDTDRLLFVLLEYMQGLAMRHFSACGLDGNGEMAGSLSMPASQRSRNPSRNPSLAQGASSQSAAQNQEIVLLIQDHDNGNNSGNAKNGNSGGIFANRGPNLVARFTAIATKYFPNLIGAILMVDIGWAAQQTLRTNQAVQRVLDVVKPEHLGRFMDPQVIPEDLGGKKVKTMKSRHQVCAEASSPTDFSQIVLRYWFNQSTILVAEDGNARPLWQPLPVYFNYQPEAGAKSSASDGNFGGGSSRRRSRSETGSTRGGGQFGDEDDGVCSVMSDDRTTEGNESQGGGLDEEGARGLQAELQAERARRVQLENELTKLTLGITLDDSTLTRLEVALKAVHGDVNVLISEVVQKSKANTSGVAGRAASGGPSLQQLIEATNRAVLQAIQEREEVPAMKFAQPTDRRAKKGCVIC